MRIEAQEWERLGDDVVVRLDADFHRLTGAAADTWLRLVKGKPPRRGQQEIVDALVDLGVVRR